MPTLRRRSRARPTLLPRPPNRASFSLFATPASPHAFPSHSRVYPLSTWTLSLLRSSLFGSCTNLSLITPIRPWPERDAGLTFVAQDGLAGWLERGRWRPRTFLAAAANVARQAPTVARLARPLPLARTPNLARVAARRRAPGQRARRDPAWPSQDGARRRQGAPSFAPLPRAEQPADSATSMWGLRARSLQADGRGSQSSRRC